LGITQQHKQQEQNDVEMENGVEEGSEEIEEMEGKSSNTN